MFDANLDDTAKVEFFKFLHNKVTLFLPLHAVLKGSLGSPYMKKRRLMICFPNHPQINHKFPRKPAAT